MLGSFALYEYTDKSPKQIALIFGLAVAFAVVGAINWRCPACNSVLGRHLSPKFCSNCGARLH